MVKRERERSLIAKKIRETLLVTWLYAPPPPPLSWVTGSIDSCHNRLSTDHYHMTLSRAQGSIHWGYVLFLKSSSDRFQLIARSIFFLTHRKKKLCFWASGLLIWNWLRTRKWASFYTQVFTISFLLAIHLAGYGRGLEILKRFWPYLMVSGAASRLVSLSNYCIWSLFCLCGLFLVSGSRSVR